MDLFDELLRGVHTDGSGMSRQELSTPWSLRFAEEADLTLVAPLRGGGWVSTGDGGVPRALRAGDVLIVQGVAEHVVLADRPSPGEHSAQSPAGPTTVVVGTCRVRTEAARRLLGALPTLMVLSGDDDCSYVLDFLGAQVGDIPPGQQIVQDRLVDWLLVCTLRGWLDQPDGPSEGRLAALTDDVVGPALRALHAAPERPWTLASLAAEAGASRTTLAQRFTRLVGRPPLTYLTDWRMALAADLLTGSTATVAAVARQTGYADAFGFSAAFKRVHGTSPSAYRDAARTNTGTGTDTGADTDLACADGDAVGAVSSSRRSC